MTHILLIDRDTGDYIPPELFGPFDTVEEAQGFAEDFREANGLPREATSDNNEEWSNAGWYFAILETSKTITNWG
jgi:hypothetical protein